MKKTIATKKELTTINARMLQGLHIRYGFDFEGVYFLERIEGAFTAKKVFDTFANFEARDFQIVFLVSDRRRACYASNELRAVKYTAASGFDVKTESMFSCGLDNFYCKKDFEECRKHADTVTYLLMQRRDLLKPVKPATDPRSRLDVTTGERYTVCTPPDIFYYSDIYGNRYFKACTLRNGNKRYNLINTTGRKVDIDYFMDKSGYIVALYRSNLARRAAASKADTQKARYAATDNTALIEALREKIKATKAAAVNAFERANTAADLKRFEMALTYYRGFTCCVNDFEDLEKKEAVKWYSSQNIFCAVYNRIWADLEKINF